MACPRKRNREIAAESFWCVDARPGKEANERFLPRRCRSSYDSDVEDGPRFRARGRLGCGFNAGRFTVERADLRKGRSCLLPQASWNARVKLSRQRRYSGTF